MGRKDRKLGGAPLSQSTWLVDAGPVTPPLGATDVVGLLEEDGNNTNATEWEFGMKRRPG